MSGNNTKVLDHLQLRVVNLEETVESFRQIIKHQVLLTNIIQRKLGVTDDEIRFEERSLHAKR